MPNKKAGFGENSQKYIYHQPSDVKIIPKDSENLKINSNILQSFLLRKKKIQIMEVKKIYYIDCNYHFN